ncbi:BON domain-containing protein [Acidovorax sp.]|uniref:BON domain-containing protein n=1 Tax=Acidovorax sp. TaxID=1872122 RepID=UPI00391F38E5
MKTDSQLQRDVSAELQWEPSIRAEHIGVEVKDGVVTLAGQVDSYIEKCNAERAAQRVSGVHAMATELKVQLPDDSQRSDAAIAGAAQQVLDLTSSVPTNAVKVLVENGWISLTGTVDWHYQRRAAAAAVRHLTGVIGVSDKIALKPWLTASAVRSDIEAALMRSSISDARKITVRLHGAEVTLAGTVNSWADRAIATNSAWGTPGVSSVVDKLSLAY